MNRPRILLVPMLSQLEWRVKPKLEEWADVAAYDAPGIGYGETECPSPASIAEEGLRQLDRMGWDTCVLAGDEFGVAIAARIAAARPEIVEGIALGHARLSNRTTGDRAPVNREVLSAFQGLARTDYRSWVRAFGQMSAGAAMGTGYGEEFVERYMESVRPEAPVAYIEAAFADQDPWDDVLRSLGVPMLMVEHSGCLLFTREGFEEAVAAFPDAETASMVAKPSASEEFALSVRGLCSRL